MLDFFLIALAMAAGGGGSGSGSAAPQAAVAAAPAGAGAYVAEDQTPTGKFTTAAEVGQILELTKANWIGVREWDGQDLVYFTQILSWRCGLHEIRYAINGGPMQVYDMPPCHLDMAAPNAILAEDPLPYTVHPLGSVETVEVELLLDDMGVLTGSFERAAVRIP